VSGSSLGDVRLVAFDVDGVFTDGRFYLSDEGVESKAFHTQDGYGIRRLLDAGIEVAVISGRHSGAVQKRMAELGVIHVVQGCSDKVLALDELTSALGISTSECAYVGDDIPDLPLLRHVGGDDVPDLPLLHHVGIAIAVANAVQALHDQCNYSTSNAGGRGAVREVCELILDAQSQ
jgi:3-deoxy-D-manno-octulosonate 8-phosphate phosphatase (KDO 8-P phosphatase)